MNDKNNIIEKELPIGFMDSGLGGLSVLKEAVRLLPYEDFIYYGDSKNAPYGVKSTDEIKRLTFQAVDFLLGKGIKALVVACNTATGVAIKELREKYQQMPIIGIEPAIKPAVICNQGGRIIVLATPMTIKQKKFIDLLETYKDEAEIVPVPCPGLMEFVEAGVFNQEILNEYLDKNISGYLSESTESMVLGCTHYPFLRKQLKSYLGNRAIHLIDGSKGTSSELKRQLNEKNLLKEKKEKGTITLFNSLNCHDIIENSKKLLNL